MFQWAFGNTLGLTIGNLLALLRGEHLHDLGAGLRTQLRFAGHGAAQRFGQTACPRFVVLARCHHLMQIAAGMLDGLVLLACFRHLRIFDGEDLVALRFSQGEAAQERRATMMRAHGVRTAWAERGARPSPHHAGAVRRHWLHRRERSRARCGSLGHRGT